MSKKVITRLWIVVITLLLLPPTTESALNSTPRFSNTQDIDTVVIFPLSNMSEDYTAQTVIAPLIEQHIQARGFKILSSALINDFLITRRIRNTDTINSAKALEIKKELGADAVLLGSIDQYTNEGNEKIAGVTLRLVSTSDCTIVWMETLSFKGSDFKGLLGLGSINATKKIAGRIIHDLTRKMPHSYGFEKENLNLFELQSIRVAPQVAGGGKEINIAARIVQLNEKPVSVQAFVGGKTINLINTKGTLYEAKMNTLTRDGRYDINLVINGNHGEVLNFPSVAEVSIDNLPPMVDLETNTVTTGGGGKREAIVFSIRPHDQISRWEIHILNKENKTVRWGKGYGALPSKVIWRGEDDFGRKNIDGEYTFRLTVWDEAENRAIFSQEVRLDSTPPTVQVDVEYYEGDEVVFNLHYDEHEAMDEWDFIVFYGDTELVKKISGKGNISKEIKISLRNLNRKSEGENDAQKVLYTLKVTDIAGNTFETSGEKYLYASTKWKKFSQRMDTEEWGVVDF